MIRTEAVAKRTKPSKKRAGKRPAKKKKTAPATRASTGGPGFDFEDHVAGSLILSALRGQPLVVGGTLQRLQMQVEALKWDIDDILATTANGASAAHLAISCKKNVQVTPAGLPADFSDRAWKLWTKTDSPMDRPRDVLALATQGAHPDFEAAWGPLKAAARGSDPNLALAQIKANTKQRRVFDGIKSAAGGAGASVTDADVLALICKIEVMPFDFMMATSKDEAAAIASARSLLAENTLAEGTRLWVRLVKFAHDTRIGTGTLELDNLWRTLRREFGLKALPDFESAWSRVLALSNDAESLIQTSLPSGRQLDRQADIDNLAAQFAKGPVAIVYGDSGTGKSAQVKRFLDQDAAVRKALWLSPSVLERATSEADREVLGLRQPLSQVLRASPHGENVLVIDSAEWLTEETRTRTKALIASLLGDNIPSTPPAWRVVIIGQTEAWLKGELQGLGGVPSPGPLEVGARKPHEVEAVLLSIPELVWLTSHPDAVVALTNLRTLAWVIQAASVFAGGVKTAAVSLVTIADRLWGYWTNDKAAIKGLMMRLAARDAEFERRIGLSDLTQDEQDAFDRRPQQCPVRLNEATNLIQFEHDLAADWARFQQLKEKATHTPAWARHAGHPLWTGALRMLGQYLLRLPSGDRTAWDVAFEELQNSENKPPLAEDILLDALFLDPSAAAMLEQRADMLLGNGATMLNRLLKRFEHVATVSGMTAPPTGPLKDLALYIEARYRQPIIGRWPAMAVFLHRHKARIAELTLPAVASVCERWLTTMPVKMTDGTAFPYRKEFAELALACARAQQLHLAKGVIYIGDDKPKVFEAAFAAAADLPDEVAAWALEMARRRSLRADLAAQVAEHRRQEAEKHQRRLAEDPEYRERHERALSTPHFPSGRKLPPWPLGPHGRVDYRFAGAVLDGQTFWRFLIAAPAAAAEVLLAVVIEGSPEEEYGTSSRLDDFGLSHHHDSYPTAFWKSPFFVFLQHSPAMALEKLLQLICFCTDRWERGIERYYRQTPPRVELRFPDGTRRSYRGGRSVFSWSHHSDLGNGQLFCALAALEKWLCMIVDAGGEIRPYIEIILRDADSVGTLGVLVNVGKHRPELFEGPLRPLLTSEANYRWDEGRVEEARYAFDGMTWIRAGEIVFEMARDWYNLPYRTIRLLDVVSDLINRNKDLAAFVGEAAATWTAPETEKERIEFQIRVEQLRPDNYSLFTEDDGKETYRFTTPATLAAEIEAFQLSKRRPQQVLLLPEQCRTLLVQQGILTDDSAASVAQLLAALDGEEDLGLEEDHLKPARVAAAVVLTLRAKEWLDRNPDAAQRAKKIIDGALEEVSLGADRSRFHHSMARSHMEFIAFLVFETWLAAPSPSADRNLMLVLISGDDRAVGVISALAFSQRKTLGARWWRLMELTVLWAGLLMVKPRHGDDDEAGKNRWLRRGRWLLGRDLSNTASNISRIRPLAVAERVEKIEAIQSCARCDRDGWRYRHKRGQRISGGLETHFLEHAFGWLVNDKSTLPTDLDELGEWSTLTLRLWEHEAWCLLGSESESTGDFHTRGQLGYKLVATLARLAFTAPSASGVPELWQPVFALGPKGHYSIKHFFLWFFTGLQEDSDVNLFAQKWRPMAAVILSGAGWTDGRWYRAEELERHVLGFANTVALARPTGHATLIAGVRDIYKTWSEKRLLGDEDNITGFCGFLASPVGGPLRLDGLMWIATAVRADPDVMRGRRDYLASAMVEFLDTLITEHAAAIANSVEHRQALLDLIAAAVSRQFPNALALQDRVKKLL